MISLQRTGTQPSAAAGSPLLKRSNGAVGAAAAAPAGAALAHAQLKEVTADIKGLVTI